MKRETPRKSIPRHREGMLGIRTSASEDRYPSNSRVVQAGFGETRGSRSIATVDSRARPNPECSARDVSAAMPDLRGREVGRGSKKSSDSFHGYSRYRDESLINAVSLFATYPICSSVSSGYTGIASVSDAARSETGKSPF